MDKSLKNFINASAFIMTFLLVIIFIFYAFMNYSTLATYNYILFILIMLTIIITLLFITAVLTVFHAYKRKHVSAGFLWIARISLRFLLPFIFLASVVLKNSKDIIRSFYIDVNNILVESADNKFLPQEILVLLPHCLQYSGCSFKITNDIANCRKCGKCCIGEIAEIAKDRGVIVSVVTGGTAARNIIGDKRPQIVLSVACERDLSSGIADVKDIPVVGMLNDRPNGPCYNTTVDVDEFRKKLDNVLEGKGQNAGEDRGS